MSTTTVLAVVPDRRPAVLLELRNAFGWAPSIWGRLLSSRGQDPNGWLHDDGPLLQLWRDIDGLDGWQQAPLILTFDTGVIPHTAFDWAATMLDEFERRLPAKPSHANHVPAVADLLRSNPEAPFVGVWGTSVSVNPFDPWDEEADAPGSGLVLADLYLLPQHRRPSAEGDTQRDRS